MASISKRYGKWQFRVSYRDPVDNKFKTKSQGGFARKSDAEQAAREIEDHKFKGSDIGKQNILFHEYYKNWIELYRVVGVTKNTLQRYNHLYDVLCEHFPAVKLVDVNKAMYQSFINEYGEKHGIRTMRQLNSYIRSMVRDAIEEQIIFRDFTKNVKIIGKPARNPNSKFLEVNDFEKLIEHSRQRGSFDNTSGLEIYFVCESGARYEESSALTWDCVNFELSTVTFNKAYNEKTKDFTSTKNQPSYRTISISEPCMDMLKELKIEQEEYFKNKNYHDPHNLVFRNKKRMLPTNTAVNKMLKLFLDEAKIKKKINFHDLRHTHISYLFAHGFSLLYISKRAGHSGPETTLKYYSHIMNNTVVDENQKLDKLFEFHKRANNRAK